MLQVIDELQVPDGAYLAACFRRHGFRRVPKLKDLSSPAYQDYYRRNSIEAALWHRQVRLETAPEARDAVVSPGREIVKARFRYEGKEVLCLAQPLISGGYNAQSRHCQGCPLKERCSEADHRTDLGDQ